MYQYSLLLPAHTYTDQRHQNILEHSVLPHASISLDEWDQRCWKWGIMSEECCSIIKYMSHAQSLYKLMAPNFKNCIMCM